MSTELDKYKAAVAKVYRDEADAIEKAGTDYDLAVRRAHLSVERARIEAAEAVSKAEAKRVETIAKAQLATPAALHKALPMRIAETKGGRIELHLTKTTPVWGWAQRSGDDWTVETSAGLSFCGSRERALQMLVEAAVREGYAYAPAVDDEDQDEAAAA